MFLLHTEVILILPNVSPNSFLIGSFGSNNKNYHQWNYDEVLQWLISGTSNFQIVSWISNWDLKVQNFFSNPPPYCVTPYSCTKFTIHLEMARLRLFLQFAESQHPTIIVSGSILPLCAQDKKEIIWMQTLGSCLAIGAVLPSICRTRNTFNLRK